jgi:hypothetical protein
MSIRVGVIVVVVAVTSFAAGILAVQNTAAAQNQTAAQSTKVMKLTPDDYSEIQQLVVRYAYALDGGLENGKAYADLFTDDAQFTTSAGRVYKGRKELLTIAARGIETPNALAHFLMNHRIQPTADGAVGQQYLFLSIPLNETKNNRPMFAVSPFRYEDVYQKTPAGWRFKSRRVHSHAERPAASASR